MHRVQLTIKQFHYGFANALDEYAAPGARRTFHVPAPARALIQAALADFTPGAVTKVDYRKPDRAPLLFVRGRRFGPHRSGLGRAGELPPL